MKLPAVAFAAAFACGILRGLHAPLRVPDACASSSWVMLAVAATAWTVSAIFLRYDSLWPAGIASLLLWVALNSAGLIARQPPGEKQRAHLAHGPRRRGTGFDEWPRSSR
jgi:hypothetical protein